jgi:hypothetical protein
MRVPEERVPASEKPVAELAADLTRQLATLVHDEIALAKAELARKGRWAGLGAGMLAAALGLAAAAGLCLLVAAIAALHLVLPLWLSALAISGGLLLGAGPLLRLGRTDVGRASPPLPNETLENAKENVQWLKDQAKSARR